MKSVYFVVGGNPDGSGGGIIDMSEDRFLADRKAAHYVALGYHGVRVMTYEQFIGRD